MVEHGDKIDSIMRDLHERAKELNCLYTVEELANDADSSLDDVFRGVIKALPNGWQYPDMCQVRIMFNGTTYQPPDYVESPWSQSATIWVRGQPVGTLEVSYRRMMPPEDEGPFLKEERRLIDFIADRLGNCVTHRQLMEGMRDWRSTEHALTHNTMQDWTVIIDLLRRTDQALLLRIARKMINHLCWSGVKDADVLLQNFGGPGQPAQPDPLLEINRPRRVDNGPRAETLVDEAFRLAAVHLSDAEIVACIHKWMKQDRASFLVNTLENYHTSLAEVGDALQRYEHATHGEVELSPSTMSGLRVSLIRRLLTGQLEFINVAKRYLDIRDFHELMHRMIYPGEGHGKIGGKSSGLLLAGHIVRQHAATNEVLAGLKVPKTWYVTSDGLYDFVYTNHLEDVFTQKYKDIDQIRQEYPDIVQVFKHSHFSPEIIRGLSLALDEFGEQPLIVRSSSLLEDRFGAAFSGKYKSLFLANQGTKQERLNALMDAIAEIYASTFGPDPIEYRAERNLLDFQEGMGILIQEVIGTRVGTYYLPVFAGVAFSHNEIRWSPRIKREDGLVRIVPGLGTRAVDRLGDDFPVLASPGQPGLRANTTVEEIVRYSPQSADLICLETNSFETVNVQNLLKECGENLPGVEMLVSLLDGGHLRTPMKGQIDFERDDFVVTFEGLLTRTPFLGQIRGLLSLLQEKVNTPVDLEFASDGKDLYLLQCRAQNPAKFAAASPIPRDLPRDQIVFSANRYVSNGTIPNVTHIVYVDPEQYSRLGDLTELNAVGRAVGKLNKVLPKRQFILMGPGRWGSRGDIKLGVKVTYSDINNTAMLIEIARRKGDYTPDVSFGTHFFQDLVEASIRYLPLYPDDEGVIFNERFLRNSGNILPAVVPEHAALADTVFVIDVPKATDGRVLRVLMNADLDEAVGVLASEALTTAVSEPIVEAADFQHTEQNWRWRLRMAERIADRLDAERFGVKNLYVIGSTKNATAGPASDIDLLVHFNGTAEQRQALERWFEGWSLCLSELNYLRTGYRTEGLLDVHIVTDEDVERQTSFAAKINAITDPARLLPLKGRSDQVRS